MFYALIHFLHTFTVVPGTKIVIFVNNLFDDVGFIRGEMLERFAHCP